MMSRTTKAASAFFLFLLPSCATDAGFERRLNDIEKELADVRQSQQLIAKKLEEIQIQISVMKQAPVMGKSTDRNGASSTTEGTQRMVVESGATASDEDLDEAQIAKIFKEAVDKSRSGLFPQAYRDLDDFIVRFSDHVLAAEALMIRGRAAFSAGDVERALSDFLLTAARYPDSKICPEALLMAGRCCEMLGRVPDAKNYYLHLVQSFPLSSEAAEANQRLKAIR